MNSFWYLFDQGLPDIACDSILDCWSDVESNRAKVGDTKQIEVSAIRNSKVIKCPFGSDLQTRFSELLNHFLVVANRDCFGFDLNDFNEYQIAQYEKGDYYIEHLDLGLEREFERKLSITVQLSAPTEYKGGDLVFGSGIPNPPSDKLKNRGAILIFPSFVPHQVKPVTDGKRMSLVGWYEGKKWC